MESGVDAQINYLLYNNFIEQKLKIKGKGRIYNPSKPPSKILTKVVGSLYKKQFPKESKPTRRIRNVKDKPEGSADVLSLMINVLMIEDSRTFNLNMINHKTMHTAKHK